MSTFCPYYKQGLYIGSTPTGETKISMCCWQQSQIVDIVTFDHPYLESIRVQGQTQIPSQCSQYCKQPGHIANERERSAIEWPIVISTDTNSKAIKTLHLEQSLTCNLKCISCSSKYSTAWNDEYQLFDSTAPTSILKKFPEEKWQGLDLSQLRRLHFTGGEPLLNRDNKKILQHLDKIGVLSQVAISYNTNGTIRPDSELLDLWCRAHFVRLFVSLDGVGSTFEYTRFPASWTEVKSNIEYFRSLKEACVLIEADAIVGVHNIFNLPEFFAWWELNCQTGSQGDPSQIFVRCIEPMSYGGKVLDLKHLDPETAKNAVSMLEPLIHYGGVVDIINYIKQHSNPSNIWREYLERLDSIRGTNWQTSLSINIKEQTC